MLKVSLLLVLTILAGCGKAPEMPSYRPKSSDTFVGKEEKEILDIKYSEPFKLVCKLRTSKGLVIKLNTEPKDQFEWALGNDLSLMRVMHYKIGTQDMIIVIKVVDEPVMHERISHRSDRFKEYYMENSPVLKIRYRRAPKKILLDGTVHDQSAYREITLYENIEQRVLTLASEVDEDFESEDLRCMLQTTINEAYKDQWQEIK